MTEAIDPPAPGTVWASVADANDFAVRLLMAHKLPEADARTVAHCLVLADLRGRRCSTMSWPCSGENTVND